jgi:hypothetical protein
MKVERMILIAFLGNYLVNNVVAGLASLVPASQGAANPMLTAQYATFCVLAFIALGIIAWWYLKKLPASGSLMQGLIFGVVGFIVTVVTAFVSGVCAVLLQTGSLAQVAQALPNFGPYLLNMTTVVLAVLWIAPSVLVGWFMQMKAGNSMAPMGASSSVV